jgi:hypothetical protein
MVPQFGGVHEKDCQHGVWPFCGFGVRQSRINGQQIARSFAALFLAKNSSNGCFPANFFRRESTGLHLRGISWWRLTSTHPWY